MRLLLDEDFNLRILRGLQRRLPELDAATVLDLGLSGSSDLEVLKAAAADPRLVLSHDVNTMSAAFNELISAGETSRS